MNNLRTFTFAVILIAMATPLIVTEGRSAVPPEIALLQKAPVMHFSGSEAISAPFLYEINIAVATRVPLDFNRVLGQNIAITQIPGRPLHGMIDRVEHIGTSGRQAIIRLSVIPIVTKLKYQNTSRTFGELSHLDVVEQIFGDIGFQGHQLNTQGSMDSQPITVQYQESDWNFISRLLESEGIHYHFQHSNSGHTMVLGDTNQSFPVLPRNQLRISPNARTGLTSFIRGQSMYSGTVEVGDYNFQSPATSLTGVVSLPPFSHLKNRTFPAGVTHRSQSENLATRGMDRQLNQSQSCQGTAANTPLQAGYRFRLVGHSRADVNREYLITSVTHKGTPKTYTSTFTCLPTNIPYRPPLSTPIPRIDGVVLGIVTGPPGSTRYVDEFGRVKIGFPWRPPGFAHFDQHGDAGWVRVAQLATGGGSVSMWLPDIGDEVVMAFEHGDPRRPVILGSLYNAEKMPPAPLPESQDLAIFRNQSNPQGSKNEIVLDGRNGQEQLNLHAIRSMNLHAGDTMNVLSNTQLLIQGDQAITLRSGSNFLTVGPNGITSSTNIVASPQPSTTTPRRSTAPLPKRKRIPSPRR